MADARARPDADRVRDRVAMVPVADLEFAVEERSSAAADSAEDAISGLENYDLDLAIDHLSSALASAIEARQARTELRVALMEEERGDK